MNMPWEKLLTEDVLEIGSKLSREVANNYYTSLRVEYGKWMGWFTIVFEFRS